MWGWGPVCTCGVPAPARWVPLSACTCVCVVEGDAREQPSQAGPCVSNGEAAGAWIVPSHPLLLLCLLRVQTIPATGCLPEVRVFAPGLSTGPPASSNSPSSEWLLAPRVACLRDRTICWWVQRKRVEPPQGHRHTRIHIPYSPWPTPAAGPPGCDAHAPPVCAVSIPVLVCVPELPATSWGPQ